MAGETVRVSCNAGRPRLITAGRKVRSLQAPDLPPHLEPRVDNPCPYCGTPMTNPRRKQCGAPDCKRAHRAELQRGFQQRYKEQHGQRYATHKHGAGQRESDRKRRSAQPHWRQLYPAAASLADTRRRRRVQEQAGDEAVVPAQVFARDNWICQLCDTPISPKVQWPDPMSASVDHVIPLARGGRHAMDNVQSAHMGCNARKCDRGDAQLA